jgi:hypothetical protein
MKKGKGYRKFALRPYFRSILPAARGSAKRPLISVSWMTAGMGEICAEKASAFPFLGDP